jgi:SET domain-containing protein
MRKKTSIKSDPLKGRGVYAAEPIKKGELIEVCHLVIMPIEEVGATLERFVFFFSKNKSAMATGNGALYNHCDTPNAWVEMDDEEMIIEISALKSIKQGEEITIDYGYTAQERKKFGIR